MLSGKLLKRIALISVFNWILIFGVFEWSKSNYQDVNIARTMAIQALVAGRIFYLLSISEVGNALINRLRGIKQKIGDIRAIGFGIAGTIVLQIIFSQWGLMNNLFATAPLNLNQWLICLLVSLPVIPVAAFANPFDPLN